MAVNFSSIFGHSPIEPLRKHMQTATACATKLIPFTEYTLEDNWEMAKKIQREICDLEHEADLIKKDLKIHLPRSLFLPMSRGDILKILDAQDRIANKAEDIAGLVIGRKIILPDPIKSLYKSFVSKSVAASEQANMAIQELGDLLATGFSGKEIKIVSDMIVKLDTIERETDLIQVSIRDKIFKIENTMPAVECMFLYKLIEWIGDLADRAQTVGGQLQLLLAK